MTVASALRDISRFYMRCARLKKPRSALDVFDESFCFLQADSCGEAIEFNGLKLVTTVEGINNLGGETLVGAKFDARISHQEIELCFYPTQPAGPLSKIVDSARVQQARRYCGHNDHYDKKDASIDDSVDAALSAYDRLVNGNACCLTYRRIVCR
jgi:hypothetical protein